MELQSTCWNEYFFLLCFGLWVIQWFLKTPIKMAIILKECEFPTQHICSSLVLIPAKWVQVILGTGIDDFLLFLVQLFWNLRNRYNLIYIIYIYLLIYIYSHIYWNYVCVPMCAYICHVSAVPKEVRRGHQIPSSWNYRWLWAVWCVRKWAEILSKNSVYSQTLSHPPHMCISQKVKERYIDNLHCH